jgi:uncharacterized repeat protein (TIGR01451 family)
MFIQFAAVVSPAQPSLAASNNDIIPGGISSKQDAVNWCNSNADIRAIYAHFGASCAAIASPGTNVVTRNTKDYGDQMFSLGRIAYGKRGEVPVKIGSSTFYARNVSSWGTYNFKALEGNGSQGKFLIMFDCGNIIVIGQPQPPIVDVCWLIPGVQTTRAQCDVCPRIPGEQLYTSECDVCPNTPGEQTASSQCDVCPEIGGIQTGNTKCDACPDKPGKQLSWAECDVCPEREGMQTKPAECDVCPDKAGIQTKFEDCDVCPDRPGIQTKKDECDACPAIPGIQNTQSECRSCEESKDEKDTAVCIELKKQASNTTQRINNADGTMAKAGDTIDYTLSAQNTGVVKVQSFAIEENISDILDYAEVVDLHGGTWDKATNIVKWPAGPIEGKATMQQKLTVKVKDPIPQTPISSSNPGTFDLTMTNVYGNSVNIKLPPNVVKTTEQVTTTLPNTGPGTSLAIGFTVTVVIAYFFARSRLLVTELGIARQEYASAGGV